MIAIWDGPLENLLDTYNVTVRRGQVSDIGDAMLTGWFTQIKGTVFHDINENGRQDPGEVGIAGFPVAIKSRVNSIMDQGSAFALTDIAGHYAWIRPTRSTCSTSSRPTTTAGTTRASRTRPTTNPHRRRRWVPASTSASCR